jgi:hypothetical protein
MGWAWRGPTRPGGLKCTFLDLITGHIIVILYESVFKNILEFLERQSGFLPSNLI